jgi:hypothetical protein
MAILARAITPARRMRTYAREEHLSDDVVTEDRSVLLTHLLGEGSTPPRRKPLEQRASLPPGRNGAWTGSCKVVRNHAAR